MSSFVIVPDVDDICLHLQPKLIYNSVYSL